MKPLFASLDRTRRVAEAYDYRVNLVCTAKSSKVGKSIIEGEIPQFRLGNFLSATYYR